MAHGARCATCHTHTIDAGTQKASCAVEKHFCLWNNMHDNQVQWARVKWNHVEFIIRKCGRYACTVRKLAHPHTHVRCTHIADSATHTAPTRTKHRINSATANAPNHLSTWGIKKAPTVLYRPHSYVRRAIHNWRQQWWRPLNSSISHSIAAEITIEQNRRGAWVLCVMFVAHCHHSPHTLTRHSLPREFSVILIFIFVFLFGYYFVRCARVSVKTGCKSPTDSVSVTSRSHKNTRLLPHIISRFPCTLPGEWGVELGTTLYSLKFN